VDLHFLLRNGISGGVLVFLFLTGIWIADRSMFLGYMATLQQYESLSAALLASTPVIGICLQGLYLIVLYGIGWMFADDARARVAQEIRRMVEAKAAWPPIFGRDLASYYDDPIFVAFYHTHAPAHLIEWARRRRSYHYLGWTLSLGAVLGLAAGLLWSGRSWPELAAKLSAPPVLWFLDGLVLAVGAALYLATRMLRDVDQMEAIWAMAYLDPALGKPIGLTPKS
jgi:hypothetical protein